MVVLVSRDRVQQPRDDPSTSPKQSPKNIA